MTLGSRLSNLDYSHFGSLSAVWHQFAVGMSCMGIIMFSINIMSGDELC